ncbi:MAG: Smr/MutS family protein [Chloroflexi bacterium]|nr:Smr/MutS family protein [Chloroflexota bacterium]
MNDATTNNTTDLRARSEELLEFPKVRDLLAGRTHFFLARETATGLHPVFDREAVERLQDETSEARLLLESKGDIGLGGMPDPRDALTRALLGGVLTGEEIVAVANVLVAAWQARVAVRSIADRVAHLVEITERISDFRPLGKSVLEALSEKGDVLDRASPGLGDLRRKVATSYNRLVRHLEKITTGPDARQALQSGAIATRGDRLVLEVKVENRKAFQGIVHDVSNTGATLFVEPFSAVELCNEWREAAAEAAREEEKVLRRLSEVIGRRATDAQASLQAAGELDLIMARARLASSMRAERAESLPDVSKARVRLLSARHPLLGGDAVPLTMSLGPDFLALVITGPNTGGKTVALKTIGLLALMHQAGMQIPAASGSALVIFDGTFADIGDLQSIERSVSTFSSHVGNVIQILEAATPRSLALIDELGTGTDPEEGSALARAVLDEFVRRKVPVVATTHHRSVAEFAGTQPGMQNASVELDPETMLPTYHFVMGVPGRSYAFAVAKRLGLPDRILDEAHAFLSTHHIQAEALLRQLQVERKKVAEAAAASDQERAETARVRRELELKLEQITRQQEDLIEKTRRELQREAADVRASLKQIQEQAKTASSLERAREEADRVRQTMRRRAWARPAMPESLPVAPAPPPLSVGDVVEVKGLGVRAEVEGFAADGRVDLRMGSARVTLDEGELRRVEGPRAAPRPERYALQAAPIEDPTNVLDLRGVRAHEVNEKLAAFIDRCVLMGVTTARVVHGRGTGAIRQAVRESLARHPSAASFGPADPDAGGDAVTVVELL